MSLERIQRLYPQYRMPQDRRQQNIPVAVERRSGTDRRNNSDRVQLDTRLQQDIFEVKSKVADIESLTPKLFEHNVTTQAPTFTSMNNMTQDSFVKKAKPDFTSIARQNAKLQDSASTTFKIGVLAAALTCAVGLSFLSSTGAIIAIGTGLYIGSRILKAVVSKEMKETDSSEKEN